MSPSTRARLELIGAAVLFSTGGAAIKWANFTGWQIASFRSGLAAVALLVLTQTARRGWSWGAALVGVAYAGCLVLSVLLLVEPVLNPVWAWAIQGEMPGSWPLLGGAIILGATTVKSWLEARARVAAPVT